MRLMVEINSILSKVGERNKQAYKAWHNLKPDRPIYDRYIKAYELYHDFDEEG